MSEYTLGSLCGPQTCGEKGHLEIYCRLDSRRNQLIANLLTFMFKVYVAKCMCGGNPWQYHGTLTYTISVYIHIYMAVQSTSNY